MRHHAWHTHTGYLSYSHIKWAIILNRISYLVRFGKYQSLYNCSNQGLATIGSIANLTFASIDIRCGHLFFPSKIRCFLLKWFFSKFIVLMMFRLLINMYSASSYAQKQRQNDKSFKITVVSSLHHFIDCTNIWDTLYLFSVYLFNHLPKMHFVYGSLL